VIEKAFAEQRSRPLNEQWEAIPGAESFLEFHQRVVGGLTGFLADIGCTRSRGFPPLWKMNHEGPRIVFVAHSGANAVSLGHLLGIEPVPWEWERFVAFHGSISVVRPMHIASSLSFSLFRFSDTSHLPKELQTR
jgi:probable phosphoglycerate mutase